MNTALKILGIVVGAFLVLGFAFIEPAKNLGEGGWVLTLAGVVIVTIVAYVLIRKVVRLARKGDQTRA